MSVKDLVKNKKVFIGETTNYRKDKTEYNVNLIISPIFDSHGYISNYICIHKIK